MSLPEKRPAKKFTLKEYIIDSKFPTYEHVEAVRALDVLKQGVFAGKLCRSGKLRVRNF